MEPVILDNIQIEVNAEQVMEKLRINSESSHKQVFMELFQKAQQIVKAKAIYKKVMVEADGDDWVIIEGIKLSSRVVKVNLEETSKSFAFVVTCGQEVEEWSNSITDMLERFWVDTIKEEFLLAARTYLIERIKDEYKIAELSQMNPGSVIDWHMSEQRNLFNIIGNPTEAIGVSLTDTFLMVPIKSISGICFAASNYANCQLCQNDCPRRKAPYDPHLWEQKYKIKN